LLLWFGRVELGGEGALLMDSCDGCLLASLLSWP